MAWFEHADPERHRLLEQSSNFFSQLPPREQEILRLAVQGLNDQDIASQSKISLHTVRRHIENMLHRTCDVYGRKLKFRQELVPKIAPYLFFSPEATQ